MSSSSTLSLKVCSDGLETSSVSGGEQNFSLMVLASSSSWMEVSASMNLSHVTSSDSFSHICKHKQNTVNPEIFA